MNLNNKFGACCNCPSLLADGRLFTSYTPRRDHNADLMKELNAKNNNEYRNILQDNSDTYINSINAFIEKNYKCNNNADNTFYKIYDIHSTFDKQFKDELSKPTSHSWDENSTINQ